MKDFEKELRECNYKLYEAELLSKRKTQFIADLSHEFKTPLNAINGFTSLMYEKELPREKQLKFLENIMNASRHLIGVVDYSIEEAKADTGFIKLYYEKFEPSEVINEVAHVLTERMKEKNIKLITELENGFITADKRRFRQLMYNLIGNAYKFNKQNGFIRITASFKDKDYHFEIEDSGQGIEEDEQAKVFDFFTQIGGKKFKNEDGSGIGLSVCKKLIGLHNGEIKLKSQPQKGSVFSFYLPIYMPEGCATVEENMLLP